MSPTMKGYSPNSSALLRLTSRSYASQRIPGMYSTAAPRNMPKCTHGLRSHWPSARKPTSAAAAGEAPDSAVVAVQGEDEMQVPVPRDDVAAGGEAREADHSDQHVDGE